MVGVGVQILNSTMLIVHCGWIRAFLLRDVLTVYMWNAVDICGSMGVVCTSTDVECLTAGMDPRGIGLFFNPRKLISLKFYPHILVMKLPIKEAQRMKI